MNFQDKPTFYIKTLGCKVNQYESEKIREGLLASGFNESDRSTDASIYIINSCTVTHKADREARRLVRQYHSKNPKARIAVIGCLAELAEDVDSLKGIQGITHLLGVYHDHKATNHI